MAQKFKTFTVREKQKVRRKGRHAKKVKRAERKQTLFTGGACRG